MCYFSLWSLEETIFRKPVPSVFQNKKMNFKPCLLNKENSVWTSQIFFFLSSPYFFLISLCHSEVGAHELIKKAWNKTEIQAFLKIAQGESFLLMVGNLAQTVCAGLCSLEAPAQTFGKGKNSGNKRSVWSSIDSSHWSNRLNNSPWKT